MTKLVRYEAMKSAIAAALTVDEVKDIRDKSEAMRAYARQAKDVQLELDAAEFRIRSEQRLGKLMAAKSAAGLLPKGGEHYKTTGLSENPVVRFETLSEMGVDKNLANRCRKLAALPEPVFEAGIKQVRDRISAGDKRVPLDLVAVDKKQRRAEREAELAARQQAFPQQKFGVILADPEWRFEPWSRDTGMDRAADNHYPTSCLEVIMARPVETIAAPDCVLFLWATVPMLPHALIVMAAWGFDYKSHAVWAKDRIGTGYWFRNKHELLLVGTRGNIPAPAPGTQWESFLDAPVGRHSAKPEQFLDLIEDYFPSLPKIELNRRGPARPGWVAWGNQAEAPIGEPAGTKPLICNGEGDPASDPGFSAGSPMGADQWSDLDIPNYLKRSPDAPERSFPSLERASVTPAVESRESESPAALSSVAE